MVVTTGSLILCFRTCSNTSTFRWLVASVAVVFRTPPILFSIYHLGLVNISRLWFLEHPIGFLVLSLLVPVVSCVSVATVVVAVVGLCTTAFLVLLLQLHQLGFQS